MSWSANTTLTLSAYHSIAINAGITASGTSAGLALNTNNGGSGGLLTFGPSGSASFTGTPTGGQSLSINGTAYTLIYSMGQLDAIDSINAVDGTSLAPYGAGLSGPYALATDLNATGTTRRR